MNFSLQKSDSSLSKFLFKTGFQIPDLFPLLLTQVFLFLSPYLLQFSTSTLPPAYSCQQDKRALPGNLTNRWYYVGPCNKRVFQCICQLLYTFFANRLSKS